MCIFPFHNHHKLQVSLRRKFEVGVVEVQVMISSMPPLNKDFWQEQNEMDFIGGSSTVLIGLRVDLPIGDLVDGGQER